MGFTASQPRAMHNEWMVETHVAWGLRRYVVRVVPGALGGGSSIAPLAAGKSACILMLDPWLHVTGEWHKGEGRGYSRNSDFNVK